MSEDRTIFPIFDPGDLENASGRCEECDRELMRLPIAFAGCPEHPTARAVILSPQSSIRTGVGAVNLKPLNFLRAEAESLAEKGYPSADEILVFLCGTYSAKPEKIVARYSELHEGIRIQAVPLVDYIHKKIVIPLLQAQSSYMAANFIATIALCGIVAEMLSNLAWELFHPHLRIEKKELTVEMQKALFGMPVENMTQEARLNLLLAVNVLTDSTYQKFKRVKDVRNEYVHFHKTNPTDQTQKEQAAEMFRLIQELVCDVIGQDFSNGSFNLNQAMFEYLQRQGMISEFPASTIQAETEKSNHIKDELDSSSSN